MSKSYDHWKTTNPADEFLGPDPEEAERPMRPRRRVPALERRHPPGCPDADWCAGNGVCYWDCLGMDDDEWEEAFGA